MSKKWKIERSFYDRTNAGYDEKTKKTIPYQYPFNSEEVGHNKWLERVQDPITKEWYKGREVFVDYDNDGNEIASTKKTLEKLPYHDIYQLTRLRRKDNTEYLLSSGFLHGYNQFGNLQTISYRAPEEWSQTNFRMETRFVEKKNRHEEICLGPSGSIMHYTVPFTPEAVDKYVPYLRTNYNLYLKMEGLPNERGCAPHGIKFPTALDMFKYPDFNYVFNADYLTEQERERLRLEYEASISQPQKKRTST